MALTHDDISSPTSAGGTSTIMKAATAHPSIEVGGGQDDAVLVVRGVVRRGSVGRVRRELEQVLDRGVSTLVVDFTAVPQCDGRVLAVLDAVRRRCGPVEATSSFAGSSRRR